MESKYCGTTRFLAFYQPYQVPEEFLSTHESVKLRIAALDYAFDISSELDMLGEDVYEDIVHVNQEAMVLLGKRIASIVAEELLDGNLKDCHLLSK